MPVINNAELEHLSPPFKVEIAPHQQTETNQKPPWSKLLLLVAFATTLGAAVPTGYCIGVINAPSALMKIWCSQTVLEKYGSTMSQSGIDILWSSVVSVFLVGGAIGSLGGAGLANKFGRKPCMLICAVLFAIGAVLFFFCRAAKSVEMLLLGRLIVGLSSGLVTATQPMYLAELAPPSQRGTLGVFCGVGVTGGVVFGQVFSLADIFGTEELWHYAISAYILLVLVCYAPSFWFPESPKFLYLIKSNPAAARRELVRLRGEDANKLIEQEIADMQMEANDEMQSSSFGDVLRDPRFLMPLFIVCCFQGGQQLSGINAIFYYSVSIFTEAGFSEPNAQWANLGAGCMNLCISLLGPLLMATCKRRNLMMLSSSLCSIFLFCIAFVLYYIRSVSWFPWACIFCILAYIFFYQFGLGPIPYFIGSELFEVAPRPVAMSMGSLSSWTCNFIVGMAFPSLQSAWGAFVFLPFSITCVLLFILTKLYLPETLGRDPSEVAPLVSKGFRSKVK
ncbi:solute carrier family 2, facilitated glucose transporter member 3-like isoform X1 [Drosophila novamexicana]|uniref:solute carrier family 2, facilitated glucose transporter member 3-like isoform X1 n=1 Tax=Drosophila novamexicana TaxID=47314 RepID=UPI0011E58A5D|nr:solute carrier family 2, facilitated glucose transporter member 3-like isoform X1 [Drosophila novamexicana]